MPVESITPEQAPEYFGWFWNFTGPDLLTDLHNMDYGGASAQPGSGLL
jgi:hypothetical protein